MSAVYKLIATRPTLNDVFWIENSEAGMYPISVEAITNQTADCAMQYAEQITWQEISDRIDELRPDIKEWLLSRSSNVIHLNSSTQVDEYLDYDSTVIDNFLNHTKFKNTKPNYNPFSLTHSIIHTYNDANELSYQYNVEYRDQLDAVMSLATTLNNTIVEEFYVNGVQINKSEIPPV
jgi:hypothetical protein